ncbi:hypothetical protein [Rubellicoccus peritrichatus]|uniref:Uncharacterized protein n=1 Tax=Rubellicoccus peritrichatus TaxID=3080537 RepID=A0AAQ3LJU0_9BACT|nr:hypothetical protein [Puniceicoccus sp. CR14]WOO43564.1 hypothetical protein RZN69_10735 [Puniceicoccus sp. CR14]
MADTPDSSSNETKTTPLDLTELQSLNFGPNWTERKSSTTPSGRGRSGPARDNRGGGGPAKDRRRGGKPQRSAPQGDGQERRHDRDRGPRRDFREQHREEIKPIVDVLFYPEDIPFKALCHAMRTNCRTYELFEIARLILDKPERFVVVIRPSTKNADGPTQFYCSAPDGVPFLTEDAAVSHVLQNHIERFFEVEDAEVEPPKGNFPSISKCGVTGELLGPPNYHRYQALIQEHHATRLSNMSFERFTSKIESVKEQETIDAWIQKMTKVKRFTIKESQDGEPKTLDGLDAARSFLLSRRRDRVVRTTDQARFSGKAAEALPKGELRKNIEAALDYQQRFPLDTANNLRGRLRRMRFTIYKRGAKGVSFVCAVKRNFRDPNAKFSDSVQVLIEFIEKHANMSVAELPEKFLGIKPKEKMKPDVEKVPDIEEVPKEQAQAIVEEHELRRQRRLAEEAKAKAEAEGTEASASEEATKEATTESPEAAKTEEATAASEEAPQSAPETAPASEKKPEPEVDSKVKDPRIRQMMMDLHWLVTEGFVVEYGDGKLLAVPTVDTSHKETAKAEKPATEATEAAPAQPTPEAAQPAKVETSEAPVAEEAIKKESAAKVPQDKPVEPAQAAEETTTPAVEKQPESDKTEA